MSQKETAQLSKAKIPVFHSGTQKAEPARAGLWCSLDDTVASGSGSESHVL